MRETQSTFSDEQNRFASGNGPGNGSPAASIEELGREAHAKADQLRSNVSEGADRGKSAMASMINDLADVVGSAAHQLDERGQASAANYVDQMSTSLADFSRSVEAKSFGDIVGDVSGLARRHPAAFVGGAMLIGMALSRVAKAAPSSVTQPFTDKVKSAVSDVKSAVADVSSDLMSGAGSTDEALK